jgi:RHS repeat-associated protein
MLAGDREFDLEPTGRITAVHAAGWTEHYAYDQAGNMTNAAWPASGQASSASAVWGERSYAGTLIRRAGGVRYEHDRQGRVVLRQQKPPSAKPRTWHYTWNADDRLTAVRTPDGQHWRYRYDPFGRRVAKQRLDADSMTVLEQVDFTWDDAVLAEQTHTDWWPSLDEPIASQTTVWDWEPDSFRPVSQSQRSVLRDRPQEWFDEAFYAIVTDLVGTPTELVSADGEVAWRANTTIWGAKLPGSTGDLDCPLRFPGQYHDPETQLNYNYHRYYDPADGRYCSGDPLGLAAAPNHHAYVPNPVNWQDPLGLAPGSYGKWMSPKEWADAEAREVRNLYRGGATETGQHGAGLRAAASELRRRVSENGYLPEINEQLLETARRWESRARGIDHGMQRGR